jgi:hypothetical protein
MAHAWKDALLQCLPRKKCGGAAAQRAKHNDADERGQHTLKWCDKTALLFFLHTFLGDLSFLSVYWKFSFERFELVLIKLDKTIILVPLNSELWQNSTTDCIGLERVTWEENAHTSLVFSKPEGTSVWQSTKLQARSSITNNWVTPDFFIAANIYSYTKITQGDRYSSAAENRHV